MIPLIEKKFTARHEIDTFLPYLTEQYTKFKKKLGYQKNPKKPSVF